MTVGIVLALRFLLYRTTYGLALRAVYESPSAAKYMGVNPSQIVFWAFIIVSLIGGVAGYLLLATDQQVTPYFGLWATFKGLIAMMLGGIGSITGAVIGGVVLGIIEAHTQWYLGNVFRDFSTYLVLFLVLIIRPGGFFGKTLRERQNLASKRV